MQYQVSNHSSKGESSPSQGNTRFQPGIVDESLLARLEEEKAPLDIISVQLLGLSARGYNALKNASINNIQQLTDCTESYLLSIRNVGVTTLDDIRNKLNSYIDTMLRTGGWDSQLSQTSADTENIASSPLEQGRTLSTLDEAFTKLLGTLTPREGIILRLRYGIDDGTPRSLEEVGQQFGITRERVRQIQKKILRKLNHPTRKRILEEVARPFLLVLQEAGGIMSEQQIHENIAKIVPLGLINPAGVASLVLRLIGNFVEIDDEVWALPDCPIEYIEKTRTDAITLLEQNLTRMRFNELVSRVCKTFISSESDVETNINSRFIESCLQTDHRFDISEDGWCALTKWERTYVDELVEVLRTEKKPFHYSKITLKLNEILEYVEPISERAVLGTLQRLSDIFVWAGPGIYGLVEWGKESPKYFIDLITEVLNRENRPMPPSEIIMKVNELRPCKESSVMMYLTLNDRFAEFASNTYGLREWLPTKPTRITSELPDSFLDELKRRLASNLPGNEENEEGSAEEVSRMADFNPAEMDKAAEEAKAELSQVLKDLEGDDAGLNAVLGVFHWWHKHYLKAGHKRLGRVIVSLYKTFAE